jgi:hypothetical protein
MALAELQAQLANVERAWRAGHIRSVHSAPILAGLEAELARLRRALYGPEG